ncbi:HAMP domain-containing protein [Desulfotignum balticum]|uniref:HAMP domain-containing protein n=1 Tax=Desulfotignum balticum TaxID=115781 RepID=UPI00041E993D|nr:HAMP domain-containing protein [Desulfotignum balticum]
MAVKKKTAFLKIPLSIKLFCSSVLSILIFTIPLFFLVNQSLKDLGQFADTANTRQIKQMANQYLAGMAREKARKYDEIFLHYQTSVTFLGMKASEIYTRLAAGHAFHSMVPSMIYHPGNAIWYTPESDPLITAFWGDKTLSLPIVSELQALAEMDLYLVMAKKNCRRAMAAHIITRTGIGKYYTLNPDMRNACFNLPNPADFDLRNGEPMTTFTQQSEADYGFRWTRPYKDDVAPGLMMTGVAPILDGNGRLKGVTGMDIPLADMFQDLDKGHPLLSNPDAPPGDFFALLMDSQGRLISFPVALLPLLGLDMDISHFKYSDNILSLNLTQSRQPVIEQITRQILNATSYQDTLTIQDRSYILASHRLHQTNWHIVLASSENNLLDSIEQTRNVMDDNLSGILKSFMIYAGIIFLVALGCSYSGVRRFVRPLQHLTRLTRRISKEVYSEKVPENRNDEIGELSRAFNEMTDRLQQSQQREKKHIQELSHQADRLKQLNEYLVHSDETERKMMASDLHDSVVQTLAMGISRTKDLVESDDPARPDQIRAIQAILEQAVREIRTLIYKLSPPILDDFDIDIAIGALIEEINAREKTAYRYINQVTDPIPLPHALKVTLYRAVNELLTNIRKHARTPNASIQLWFSDPDICLQVKDAGAGMDVQALKPSKDHGFGLYSLSERIQNFGGTLTITSTPGKGTKILLTAPVNQRGSNIHE